jgi:hypothetical protein
MVSPSARLTLECYYTAAMWLQTKYWERLVPLIGKKGSLTDHFSKELMVSDKKHPDENLQALARRHQELSKKYINWLGTYEHGAQRFIIHLEKQKAWKFDMSPSELTNRLQAVRDMVEGG